jgi:hypothetical protein
MCVPIFEKPVLMYMSHRSVLKIGFVGRSRYAEDAVEAV